MPIQPEWVGDYFADPQFRERFQNWLNQLWAEKDQTLESLFSGPGVGS